jgi:hypothetical protein
VPRPARRRDLIVFGAARETLREPVRSKKIATLLGPRPPTGLKNPQCSIHDAHGVEVADL